jgi:phage terminase small subunit
MVSIPSHIPMQAATIPATGMQKASTPAMIEPIPAIMPGNGFLASSAGFTALCDGGVTAVSGSCALGDMLSINHLNPFTSMADLTPKQQKFVEEYLIDLNATQAAIRAGYSEHTASSIGHENLSKPEIQEAIAARRKAIADEVGITPEKIVAEFAKIGFCNMQDYLRVTGGGDPFVDLSEMTLDQAAAVAEVTVEDFVDGRGDDARDVRKVRFKLADKRAALVDIGKHLGMFKERVEHSGNVTFEQSLALLGKDDPA